MDIDNKFVTTQRNLKVKRISPRRHEEHEGRSLCGTSFQTLAMTDLSSYFLTGFIFLRVLRAFVVHIF